MDLQKTLLKDSKIFVEISSEKLQVILELEQTILEMRKQHRVKIDKLNDSKTIYLRILDYTSSSIFGRKEIFEIDFGSVGENVECIPFGKEIVEIFRKNCELNEKTLAAQKQLVKQVSFVLHFINVLENCNKIFKFVFKKYIKQFNEIC